MGKALEEFVPSSKFKAVLTDSHFWVPVVVLALGMALLVYLH